MDHTFTFSLVFRDSDEIAQVATIVCHGEDEIDIDAIQVVTEATMKNCFTEACSANSVAHAVCKEINEQCECQAVVVLSDIAVAIDRADAPTGAE